MSDRRLFQHSLTMKIVAVLGCILAIIVIFQAGITVGYHKAAFTYNWNESYLKGPRDPRSVWTVFMHDGDDLNPHGITGEIVSVSFPNVMVKGFNNAEEMILVTPTTTIRSIGGVASTSELSNGRQIVVFGTPDNKGGILASFIRIIPKLPESPLNASMPPPSGVRPI